MVFHSMWHRTRTVLLTNSRIFRCPAIATVAGGFHSLWHRTRTMLLTNSRFFRCPAFATVADGFPLNVTSHENRGTFAAKLRSTAHASSRMLCALSYPMSSFVSQDVVVLPLEWKARMLCIRKLGRSTFQWFGVLNAWWDQTNDKWGVVLNSNMHNTITNMFGCDQKKSAAHDRPLLTNSKHICKNLVHIRESVEQHNSPC